MDGSSSRLGELRAASSISHSQISQFLIHRIYLYIAGNRLHSALDTDLAHA
jgi:hypothetical protein